MNAPLRAYQQENIDWIQKVGRGLLADEPGLGKSRSALEGFAGAGKVLIVAPNLVAKTGVWHDEVALWGDDNCEYHLATYHDLNRRKPTPKGGLKMVNVLKPEWKGHWDAVIIDEAHYIKGRDNHWTWAVKQLARDADRLLLMTGTPIPNWSHEVFTLLQCIYPEEGKRGNELGSFWRWADQWFDTSPNPHNAHARILGDMAKCRKECFYRDPDDPCEHYAEFAAGNFGERYMRHLRADHLDLPPIEFTDVTVRMDPDTARSYRELKRNFATDIGEKEILTWSMGAKNVALDRMTTSPWMLNPIGEPDGGKLARLRYDLNRIDEPVLVLAHYRDSVEAAAAVADAAGRRAAFIHGGTTDLQNANTVRAFKAGDLDVLVGSLETLAEGLTLTVASTAIFLERSYKPSRNTQATYRIYRLGQDKPCQIIRYITPNSIDSGKEKLLAVKNDRQMRTLTAADWLRVA